MFTHILLPTDGSELSEAAIRKGVQFAKSVNARITGLCVMPKPYYYFYEMDIPPKIKAQSEEQFKAQAAKYLAVIADAAREAGVACETVHEVGDMPYETIIRVAEQKGCDLIMMASHGRRGVKGLLLGSETQKVLTHSKVPVLVYR
jgi:nucleotide-binding universal stress UspA family protein